MTKIISSDSVNIGDILFLGSIKADGQQIGSRPFIVWGKDEHSLNQVMMYEISGQKKTGDEYPYNIPIPKSPVNGLNLDSHIKADQLFIYCENNIQQYVKKIGELEPEKYSDINEKTIEATEKQDFYFYDQSNNGLKLNGW